MLQSINHSHENRRGVQILRVIEQRVQYTIICALSGAGAMLSDAVCSPLAAHLSDSHCTAI